MNPKHAQIIRAQGREDALRAVAVSWRTMSLWKRLKLALFARWY